MPAATSKPKGLATKLAEVMGLLDNPLPKKGFNKAQTYAFVNESDVSAAIRPLLAERNVWLWTSEVGHTMEPLFKTSSGTQMWNTVVTMEFQFIDGETGEVMPIQKMSGHGADTGDKGYAKAVSMALKYYLLKSFMLSTGKDDNESDERVDKAAAASGAAAGPTRVTRGSQAGVQRGGKSGIATKAQVDEIARISRDMALELPALIAAVTLIVGQDKPEEVDLRGWLGSLTSEQAAKVIASLPTHEADVEEDGGEVEDEEDLTLLNAATETFSVA